jgi:hypothetical protein
MLNEKSMESEVVQRADSALAPKYNRDLWFYLLAALTVVFILVIVISFFTVPAFNVSYHSFDANGNPIIVSFDYDMLEIMTNARPIIELLEMVTFEAEEARSGLQTFVAWLTALASLLCIIAFIRFIYILFTNIDKCLDAGKFAFSMIILLLVLMVAVAYFLNPASCREAIRVFGFGSSLSDAYQFSFTMFPFLIIQYIMIIAAIIIRTVFFRKLEVGLKVYFNSLKEFKDIRTVKTWVCAKCNKENLYYSMLCTDCGAKG